ncbi:HAD family hydrolase [Paenirhodobacter populi]|uniref:HAD family phosphatase n=1 Tax=Paenirhodobacter populi TaxID=2306993 RepID=A0A443IW43_9RHOB|nr:HAD-IA family hydrolase [Sinirhodobacter populi]RWR12352.1 HAD family phosphatase [Sinirhodobacter populi]
MVEAVIFDIGNVLIEWRPERHYDRLMPPAERAAMFAEIDLHSMNEVIDRGGPFLKTVRDWADRYPRWRDPILRWHEDWIHMASPEIPQSVRLLRALRAKGVPVFALTNFGIETFRLAQEAYPFLTEFDRAYVSGHMGVTKPDPRIYDLVEADCGLTGARLLFADDRADNIAAAAARGWKVHTFDLDPAKGAREWAARLVAEGLLDADEAR